ncbi:hypothetical protein [Lichenihabitans psoromatis]|uniref:hypothetical protein n=1 Tax=Lichenihabitans psoromatis TaxID=2528642 RepID=UPI00103832CD|nr:hypothetical protein [Lichenihabitans psoromatis]
MATSGQWLLGGVVGFAVTLGLCAPPEATARYRRCVDCIDVPNDDGYGDPDLLFPGRPYENIPFQWDDGRPASDNPPLPQGFVMTVPVGPDGHSKLAAAPTTLNRYVDVASALGACWVAPSAQDSRWGQITLRVSFKRDGSVNGIPRLIAAAPPSGRSTESDLKSSLLSALSHCAPLHISPSLGNAIAGQIFAISFVQQGQ